MCLCLSPVIFTDMADWRSFLIVGREKKPVGATPRSEFFARVIDMGTPASAKKFPAKERSISH